MTINPKLETILGLLIILSVLSISDFFITKLLIDIYGFEVEANPLMYKLIVLTNTPWSMLYVKMASLLMCWIVFWRTKYINAIKIILISLIIIHTGVVGKGIYILCFPPI